MVSAASVLVAIRTFSSVKVVVGVEDGVDTFFGECDVVAITSADDFDSICLDDDNNIFSGECGGGVEGGVDTFFGEGDVVVGGTMQKP